MYIFFFLFSALFINQVGFSNNVRHIYTKKLQKISSYSQDLEILDLAVQDSVSGYLSLFERDRINIFGNDYSYIRLPLITSFSNVHLGFRVLPSTSNRIDNVLIFKFYQARKDSLEARHRAIFDFWASKFLKEKLGEEVAASYALARKRSVVVKEYISGFNITEIEAIETLSDEFKQDLQSSLTLAIMSMKHFVLDFHDWLLANAAEDLLLKSDIENCLIYEDSDEGTLCGWEYSRRENWVFHAKKAKWVLVDP